MALSRPGRTTTTTVTLNSKLDSGSQRLRKASCLGWPLPQSSRGHWYFKTVILRTSRTVPGNSVSQILRTLTFQDVQTVSIWMPIYIVYNHIIYIYIYKIYIWYSSISAIKLCAVAELNTCPSCFQEKLYRISHEPIPATDAQTRHNPVHWVGTMLCNLRDWHRPGNPGRKTEMKHDETM